MKKIFLIGMMGCGKTTIGKLLAQQLKLSFIDTDELIVREEARSIREIFQENGALYFRQLEKKRIEQLPDTPSVVACGGGLPCFEQNLDVLSKQGVVIYLKAEAQVLFERIKTSNERPLLETLANFEQLYQQREPTYQKAHFVINANQSTEIVTNEIISILAKNNLV